ncbi:iron-siderophore ABC transporter substrate-binding protein [Tenggerimyces flavus]|uniref:Iron-siderophore ABC transporter substrate-binding protein n=1 Tax=Tenggerimyces flavus TaxID=1708749 RepID=A0ABV7YFH2_9ACTN|nr:iron-siderophore ABC transporter substrate-binding protein [Tenggerimyces flavus]MBM7783358.1 iron complex transport system substrate-binding protein [Tenggerimyces flavus]
MRRRTVVAGIAALTLAAAGCGSGGGGQASIDDKPTATTDSAGGGGGFPVTIEHAKGKTTIEAKPERVVTVGYTDQEPLLALGIKPVGVMDWFGERPYGDWPWEKPLWGGTQPDIIGGGGEKPSLEKIAALDPDLIIGLYSGGDDVDKTFYDKLTAIAPTVLNDAKYADYTTPWQEMTLVAGKATGQEDKAKQLIKDIEDRFAKVRQEHPEFAEQTAAVVDAGNSPKSYYPFASTDPRGQFMTNLGFKPSTELDAKIGKQFGIELSPEQLQLLEVDRLVLLINPKQAEALKKNQLFQQLKVAKEGRVIYLPYDEQDKVGASLAFNSVLSIPYGIDKLVPLLTAKTG